MDFFASFNEEEGEMKVFKTLCLATMLAVMAFAPGKSFAAAGQTLVYGTTEKITDMDPASAYDFHTWEIFDNIYQGLLKYPAGETKLVPGLAKSYKISPDGKTYTFDLRQGLKFTDGTPFNAQAVKWSIDRVMALKGDPSWLVTDFVDHVKVVNDHTVQFVLKHPVAYFPALIASPPYFPVNPNVYPKDKIIRDPSQLKGGKLVGLGPYKVVSFKRDQEIVMEANPKYYGPKPKNQRIVIRYFADATTMRLALQRGDLDFAFKTFNPSDIKDLQKDKNLETIKGEGPFIRYLCFVCDTKPFKNKVLRQAVAAAINRPPLLDKVFLGQNEPLYSMVPKGMWSHIDAFKKAYGDGNLALSRKLLASQGYNKDHKFVFDLWYTPSHYGDTEVDLTAVLKDQLEATGVMKVNVHSAEWATYKDNYKNKVMPAFLLGWYPDYLDPDDYLAAFASTDGSRGNGIYFSNPKWDKMFKEGQTETSQKKRAALYEKIQKMWTDQVPTCPIFQGNLYVFAQKNVRGIKLSPTLQLNYGPIHTVK